MTDEHPAEKKRYHKGSWPPLRGDYVAGDPEGRVAVVTLASHLRAEGAAISGTCKTENLGVEKIVANVISNSNIRFLLICGAESKGHLPGDTILALHRNGIDDKGRIIGSKGAIPFIQNLPREAIKRFQDQIQVIDKIGLEDEQEIEELVGAYSGQAKPYSQEPFQAVRPTRRHAKPAFSRTEGGYVLLGSGLALDSHAWLVREGEFV